MVSRIDQDHARFREIARGQIKKHLKQYISKGEMIGRQGKNLVTIPIPQVDIPQFRFGSKQQGGVGQGEGASGTPIGAGDPQDGSGQAGDSPGQHVLEVELTFEELAQIMAEELALPNIEPKGRKNIVSEKERYTGIRRVGPESLRHFKRTYREALKRQLASGAYNPTDPRVVPIRDDKRYRSWKEIRRPESNAVIIYMMDVSGCHTTGHSVEMADGSYKDVADVAVGDRVCCVDVPRSHKTTSVVTETFHYRVQKTVLIHTEDHLGLRVTPNHRYFVYDEGHNRIIEKFASDLREGDQLILVNRNGDSAPSETIISEDEAYLLGAILSDDHISLTIQHSEEKVPILCKHSPHRSIDPLVFRQHPTIRAAFLRGLFDAQGTVRGQKVQFFSSNATLIKQVKLLLSYWGIRARVTRKTELDREIQGLYIPGGELAFHLSINAEDVLSFAEHIGFACESKQAKLKELVAQQSETGNGLCSWYIAPLPLHAEMALLDLRPTSGAPLYEQDRSTFPERDLRHMLVGATPEQVALIQQTLDNRFLVCRVQSVLWLDQEVDVYDFTVDKYNNYIVDGILSHNSMGDEQKEIVRIEAFWIDTWLRSQYENLETRYIIHDAVAREVDRHTFFHTRESGGTMISSAYSLCNKLIDEQFSPDEWNVYPFHFSDGDNWGGGDTEKCLKLLDEQILPKSNLFCYGQVESYYGSGEFIHDLQEHYGAEHDAVVLSEIEGRDGIYDSIKQFLGKGR